MAWIGTSTAAVNPAVKLTVMLSGGSCPSWSVTALATTVNVHDSPLAKSTSGLIVNVVGPPETAAVCGPEAIQRMLNHDPVTFTGSLNVTVMLWSGGTFVAPFAGTVLTTVGASSPILTVAVVLAPRS